MNLALLLFLLATAAEAHTPTRHKTPPPRTVNCPPATVWSTLRQHSQRLILPSDGAVYNQSRQAVNERFNATFPCAVVYAGNTEEVVFALSFARQQRVPFAVRSGGHSYEGFSLSPGLIIDLSAFNQTIVHAGGTATIGAGTRLISMYDELAKSNHVLPGGSCPDVAMGGFTLGGGYGLLSRQLGLMVDSLLETLPRLKLSLLTAHSSSRTRRHTRISSGLHEAGEAGV